MLSYWYYRLSRMTCLVGRSLTSFIGVLRRQRLEFLIHNILVIEQEQVGRKSVAYPGNLKVFSPKDMRKERWEGPKMPEVCWVLHDAFTPAPNAYTYAIVIV